MKRMKGLLFPTLKNYKKEYLKKDIFSGIIMAAVSDSDFRWDMHRLQDFHGV